MLDFSKVKGYEKLTLEQQAEFSYTATKHFKGIGEDDRADYIPSKVTYNSTKKCLDVTTKGKKKFHYQGGKWF